MSKYGDSIYKLMHTLYKLNLFYHDGFWTPYVAGILARGAAKRWNKTEY